LAAILALQPDHRGLGGHDEGRAALRARAPLAGVFVPDIDDAATVLAAKTDHKTCSLPDNALLLTLSPKSVYRIRICRMGRFSAHADTFFVKNSMGKRVAHPIHESLPAVKNGFPFFVSFLFLCSTFCDLDIYLSFVLSTRIDPLAKPPAPDAAQAQRSP
jgi:hypothetical protein